MRQSSLNAALTAIFAALYFAITVIFQPISFLAIQVRVSGALILLCALFPEPILAGVTIGVFFANMLSPLGAIDLISAPITFLAMLPLYFLRKRGDGWIIFGGALKSVVIAAWVSLELRWVYHIPFIVNFPLVLIGDLVAVLVIGYPVYRVVKRYLPNFVSVGEKQAERISEK
jgi:uncharacterized membrane protein